MKLAVSQTQSLDTVLLQVFLSFLYPSRVEVSVLDVPHLYLSFVYCKVLKIRVSSHGHVHILSSSFDPLGSDEILPRVLVALLLGQLELIHSFKLASTRMSQQ